MEEDIFIVEIDYCDSYKLYGANKEFYVIGEVIPRFDGCDWTWLLQSVQKICDHRYSSLIGNRNRKPTQ